MAETLVIRLRANEDAPASWLLVDPNGARSGPVQSGPVADALGLAADRRVVLLLPGAEITLAEPELPMRAGSKLAQAVPFALEEQLASEVDGLHFAIGTRGPSSVGTPVATVARTLMDRWVGAVQAAGIHPNAAYSDATSLPATPNACTLLLDEGMLYVRRADALPYVLDAQPLDVALDLALGAPETDDGAARPQQHVTFYASPQEYEAEREVIEGLRTATETLQVKLLPEGPLPLLAAHALATPSVNLLQGAYGTNVSIASKLRAWRLPAALAAMLLLVFGIAQGLQLWQLSREAKRLDGQIAQLVQQLLPGQPVVDARAQIQGVLGKRGGPGESALLPTLSALAFAMAQTPQGRVEALSYRGDALDLRVVAPSVEALDGIKQTMASRGMNVELQSATPRGEVVEGRLQVKMGAA